MTTRQSWADLQGIPKFPTYGYQVRVPFSGGKYVMATEENRATVYEYYRDGIETLMKIAEENYLKKGVAAIVIGIQSGEHVKYAVFVEDGFLVPIEE